MSDRGSEVSTSAGDRTLWLIGMMGSGKTTVGRLVAESIGRRFVDLDTVIAERSARTVDAMMRDDEARFRRAEVDAVVEVAGQPVVVATGGGVVLDGGSVARMRASGLVVWLEVGVRVLTERVGDGAGRPLLGDDPVGALERILGEREALYREAADAVVDAGGEPSAVAARVCSVWEAA